MDDKKLTNNFAAPVPNNEHSLTAGERGPILLQDYFLIEKLAHFLVGEFPEKNGTVKLLAQLCGNHDDRRWMDAVLERRQNGNRNSARRRLRDRPHSPW